MIKVVKQLSQAATGVTTAGDGNAQQQRKYDHLQHIPLGHGLEGVAGKDIDQYLL